MSAPKPLPAKSASANIEMVEEMHAKNLSGNISIKLTQLGLDISKDLCASLARLHRPPRSRSWRTIEMDMEGSVYTGRHARNLLKPCSANTAIPDSPSRPICIAQKRICSASRH